FRKSWFYRNNRRRARRLWRQDKGHRAELEAFVQAVRSNGGPPVSFDSLYATTLATFRIRESLACGAELPVSPPHENSGKCQVVSIHLPPTTCPLAPCFSVRIAHANVVERDGARQREVDGHRGVGFRHPPRRRSR